MPIERSEVESARFGVEVARTVDLHAGAAALEQAALKAKVDLLITRICSSKNERLAGLQDNGHQVMDCVVRYRRTSLLSRDSYNGAIRTRLANEDDLADIADISRLSFLNFGGHYHADPRLPNSAATEGYVDWACRTVTLASPDFPVFVAEMKDRVVGFLTMRNSERNTSEIVLNAVHPTFQRQGAYSRLLASAIAYARDCGAEELVVATQVDNLAPQRAWIRHEFLPEKSFFTLHKWFS